jgi:dTDP-4-dehydrorhamnose reductase
MIDRSRRPPPEVWAGLECTCNRVGDRYFDQLARGGHDRRLGDLDLIAELGVRALRYPVLWERSARDGWAFADERLPRLRDLGVRVIAGLVHHGSGPVHTSLVDPTFPEQLAAYAGEVARRYPWLDAYTPVNEPLTTARFSGLYGLWYPHGKDDATFVRALLVECRATALAMRAIRAVRPDAELVQTDDLGWTHATPRLAYQADLENERRWLGWDLLCGRVDARHPLRAWLEARGATAAELDGFVAAPCPPDVIGGNYYITSERWLDEDLARWPAWSHGGNGVDRYADVEAVRAGRGRGVGELLVAAWERYHRPVAITECHLGCTREEQLRWLVETWDAACAAQDAGAEVRAFTVWSVLGSYDWHCLVTRDDGVYEPGVFDVRGAVPRPTALAAAVRALARGERPSHPGLAGPGWWRRAAAGEEEAA